MTDPIRAMTGPAAAESVVAGSRGPVDSLPASLWEISLRPADCQDAAWRSGFLSQIRATLEQKFRDDPQAQHLIWRTPLGTVEVRPRPGHQGGGPLKLAFAADAANLKSACTVKPAGQAADEPDQALPGLRLPDDGVRDLGQRLVGLEETRRAVLLRWGCAWDGTLDAWARKVGCPVPPALRDLLGDGHAVSLFGGDPGTGKSALAKVVADDYARRQGIGAEILWLSTQARGLGLVGDFSRRLRAAFAQLAALPEDALGVLVVEEAEALTMRRSEGSGHQEDRSATATVLQCLDEIAGRRRLAVILTSNVPDAIDPAVRRRANLFAFGRPDAAARRTLLARWLPHLGGTELDRAALAAAGMTPADMDRALGEAWLAAVGAETGLEAEQAVAVLGAGARTDSV